jgi:hypothetical protein
MKENKITQEEAVEILNLFIEKANKLRFSTLVKTLISNQGSRIRLKGNMEARELSIEYIEMDADQIDAFLLTMRLFIQDNERISISNIAKLIKSLRVSDIPGERFAKQRAFLNKFFDGKSLLSINGDRPTYREIMETVLYSSYAHLNREKYKRYKSWTKNPIATAMIHFEFIGILQEFITALRVLENNCRQIVKELTADIPNNS